MFLVVTYGGRSEENILGFASAWDFQNMDYPGFRIFWPPKVISTLRKQPTEHDVVVIEGRRYSSSVQ